MRVAIVIAEPTCPITDLNANDVDVAGEYDVVLDDDVTEAQIADVALDVFYSNIPVKMLEDFTLTVVFNDQEMTPNPEHESSDFQHRGSMG